MIRHAKIEDAAAIALLIEPYIDDFAVNQSGREKLNQEAIETLLHTECIHYYVYTQHQQVCAVIAYKESGHLIHFFTARPMQKQGIGRKLWNFIEAELHQSGTSCITVNSSCSAQPVYEKLGFHSVSAVIEANGLRFIQMRKDFTA